MSSKYSHETRAAVMAQLLAGQSISSVAKEYNIPKGTVSGWKNKKRGSTKKATQKKAEEIGDLLVKYLRSNLETLEKQAIFFGNEDWLKKQTASDNAVLHGVMTDKSVRLLEALSGNGSDDNATES